MASYAFADTEKWWPTKTGFASGWRATPAQNISSWLAAALPAEGTDWTRAGSSWEDVRTSGMYPAWQEFYRQYQKYGPSGQLLTWNTDDLQRYFTDAWTRYINDLEKSYYQGQFPQVEALPVDTTGTTGGATTIDPTRPVGTTIPETTLAYGSGRVRNPTQIIPGTTPESPSTDIPTQAETLPEAVEIWQEEGYASEEAWLRSLLEPYLANINQMLGAAPLPPDYSGLQASLGSLISRMQDPYAQWGDAAQEWAAKQQGFDDVTSYMNYLAGVRDKGPADYTGMTPEYRQQQERKQRLEQMKQMEEARKQAETIFGAAGGSVARLGQYMDEANAMFANEQAKFQAGMIEQDFAIRMAEMEREKEDAQQLMSRGMMTAQQYIDTQMRGTAEALQGYMQQAALMSQQFQEEWTGINNQVQLNLEAAALATGGQEWVLNMLKERYDTIMQPYIDQQTFEVNQQTLDQMIAAAARGDFALFVQMITSLLGAVVTA